MYYNEKIENVEKKLKTSLDGLTNEEAKKRLKEHGKNTLPKKKKDSIIKIFLNEFKSPIIILLLFYIIASLIVGETIDAIAIAIIVLIDAVMSTYQENKANNTAEALDKLVADKVKIVRDGKITKIDSTYLTIGDLVLLESGDKITADLRIIEAHSLMVDESVLTGESIQVNKNSNFIEKEKLPITEQTNMLFEYALTAPTLIIIILLYY